MTCEPAGRYRRRSGHRRPQASRNRAIGRHRIGAERGCVATPRLWRFTAIGTASVWHDVAVRFSVKQHFVQPPDEVIQAYADPEVWERLPPFERVKIVEVLGRSGPKSTPVLRVRYRFVADLPSAARAVLDPAKLTWVQQTTFDMQRRTSRISFFADHYADRFKASAVANFTDDEACTRSVSGDLRIKVLLVAGQVENAIVDGLKDYLHEERAAMAKILDSED